MTFNGWDIRTIMREAIRAFGPFCSNTFACRTTEIRPFLIWQALSKYIPQCHEELMACPLEALSTR